MQPLPSHPLLPASVASVALVGMLCAGTAHQLQARVNHGSTQPLTILASSEEDRGSGRLAHQADYRSLLSFRGSGRVQPGPDRSTENMYQAAASYYRGSGRFG